MRFGFSGLVLVLLMASDSALAQVKLHGTINTEVEDTWAFDADNEDDDRNILRGKIEPYLILQLNDALALETSLAFERQQSFEDGDDVWFDNNGLAAEEIKLTLKTTDYGFEIGKFNPDFGVAWSTAPGFWGDDFADDYEMKERIGGGANINFGSKNGLWGTHTLTAGAFMLDTSLLSDSMFTKRDRTRYDDGGPGNTHGLNSYTLQWDSHNLGQIQGLTTHLGYRHQQKGDEDPTGENEDALAAGLSYAHQLTEQIGLVVMGEYAGFSNYDTSPDAAGYLTTGATLLWGENWFTATTYASRDFENTGRDVLGQGTVGYKWHNGVTLEGGYLYRSDNGDAYDAIGSRLKYKYSF